MSSPRADPLEDEHRSRGGEDEGRVALLAATRLANEASEALRAHARLVEQVRQTAQAALNRIAGAAGKPAQVLHDVALEIATLHALASNADCAFAAAGDGEFCRPDIILDGVVAAERAGAGKRGVAIDYVCSFADFTMFGAPAVLAALMRRCIHLAVCHCRAGAISLRANFYDAHGGRRMLRLVLGAEGGLHLSGVEIESLAVLGRSTGASIEVKDGALIVMLRAPLAAPTSLFSAQPDLEAQPAQRLDGERKSPPARINPLA
ncbi:MAG TPA: hypothetical protein VG735_07075 [Caulobacterales bacterium]|nr:hypothetical protein [Caulobacterales bacterium]